MRSVFFYAAIVFTSSIYFCYGWGFFGHKLIAEWSIYAVPNPLFNLYSTNINSLKNYSIAPDQIKNIEPFEYCRHYIDMENVDTIDIINFNIDSCLESSRCCNNGILPYIIEEEFNQLITAFKSNNINNILFCSGKLSHYVSDLCVPFHTTENYDGQLSNQEGIHALWESYLPERNYNQINLFGIKAEPEHDINSRILLELENAHDLVDSILGKHFDCLQELGNNSYGFFERRGKIEKGYSRQFMDCFYSSTKTDIEGQLIKSIALTSDLWLTAWIYAGKPNLNNLETAEITTHLEYNTVDSSINFNKRKHE